MDKSFQDDAELIRKEQITSSIYRLTFSAPQIAGAAKPGQFVMLNTLATFDPLLRRPFSIHQISSAGHLQILFKVLGKGTQYLSQLEVGEVMNVIGPLGKGFQAPGAGETNIALVGGGMGIAPLYFLGKWLVRNSKTAPINLKAFLGAANGAEVTTLADDFKELGIEAFCATDDGSFGEHGLVTALLDAHMVSSGLQWNVFSCGPYPMMKAVAAKCSQNNWPCQVSMETMMACGISACLGCAIPKVTNDIIAGPGAYHYVCKDGPVFQASEIEWP